MAARIILARSPGADVSRLESLLGEARCECVVTNSVDEAIALAAELLPTICIVPATNADVHGYDACRRLAMHSATRGVNVVFIAERRDSVDPLWARLHGARAVLREPFTRNQVHDMLLVCSRTRSM